MRKIKATSEIKPRNEIKKIGANKYSCRICDNIISEEDYYVFDSYRNIFYASTYEQLLVNIIHTRYSYDDENNFINDYLSEGITGKYQTYRDFVSWAKEKSKQFFN